MADKRVSFGNVPIKAVDAADGTGDFLLGVSGVTSGGGSGGDASSANQATQITAANTTNTNLGAPGDAAAVADNSNVGILPLTKRTNQNLTTLTGKLPTALGGHGGLVVEGVASGTPVPISGSVTASGTVAVTGVATETTLSTIATEIGATNETAATADIGTFGLNALIKRVIAKLTTITTGGLPFNRTYDGTLTSSVANGGTTTAEIDLGLFSGIAIFMDSAFDGTQFTFQAAPASGGVYGVVKGTDGNPITWTTGAGSWVVDEFGHLLPFRFIKIVTSTTQTGATTIAIARKA